MFAHDPENEEKDEEGEDVNEEDDTLSQGKMLREELHREHQSASKSKSSACFRWYLRC